MPLVEAYKFYWSWKYWQIFNKETQNNWIVKVITQIKLLKTRIEKLKYQNERVDKYALSSCLNKSIL